MIKQPQIFEFPKLGNSSNGYISPAEKKNLPFVVKRIYWTYCMIITEMLEGLKTCFILDTPLKGLYIPKLCWREMKYTHNAVQMCIASIAYEEKDYIRDYKEFKTIK